MDTITEIISRTNTETDWMMPTDDTESPEWERVDDLDADRLHELCVKFDVAPEFVLELTLVFDSLRKAVHDDLADIWQRLDKLEQ